MNVAALVVAIVSALAAVGAVVYARRLDARAKDAVATARASAAAAERSAVASEKRAALEGERRHAELTPRFRVLVERANEGIEDLRLRVFLSGPPELGRLDSLTVRVRDDHPWRAEGTPLAGGPTQEQVEAQIWGPYRFVPGTGPGASPGDELGAADATGRVTPTGGMPVGESLPFFLEPTMPPRWSQQPLENWRREQGALVRLRLECSRQGESWSLPCEVDMTSTPVTVEVP